MKDFLFTSESVTEGHPDKICDQIADGILDAIFKEDKYGRVACEVTAGMGYVIVGGEITTKCWVDVAGVVRQTIREIGYEKPEYGFDCNTLAVFNTIHEQSPDIALGVRKTGAKKQGAGDQGLMTGYACKETKELMPLPIMLAHQLSRQLAKVRRSGAIKGLRPDGKSQVTVKYKDGIIKNIHSVVMAAQHDPQINLNRLREEIIKKVIIPVCKKYLTNKTKFYINNTGRFVLGGPVSDVGMSGRKTVVDTYGGMVPIGGGSFSGKDPTKVDRSAAYMARYVAKNIVAAGLADKCLIQLAYVIGGIEPLSINLDTFNTAKIPDEKILKIINRCFDLSPAGLIRELDLLRPIYRQTACYGHFGRKEASFTWEKTDRVKDILKIVKRPT